MAAANCIGLVLIGILSRGHVLLEGLPGLGKTALVRTIGQILKLDFKRIQFTPDLMPGDVLGTHILQETSSGKRELVFQPGPVFTNILLADEINRASPKTQSAMLETMQENSVTLLGTTRTNCRSRFSFSRARIRSNSKAPIRCRKRNWTGFSFGCCSRTWTWTCWTKLFPSAAGANCPRRLGRWSARNSKRCLHTMGKIYLPHPVSRYIARLVSATHPGGVEATEPVNKYVSYGASPRAAIAIAEAARAHALVAGRPSVGFEDVKVVAQPVLNHRLILNYQARFDRMTRRSSSRNCSASLTKRD